MPDNLPADVDVGDGLWRPAIAIHLEKNAYAVRLQLNDEVVGASRSAKKPLTPRIRIAGTDATFVPSQKFRVTKRGEWVMLALVPPD